ncbi:MAG: PorT family protein [Tannerellaceae bacterium]|nr:PorT family protein [Tannerellaceae bacterium]MCC8199776.1 PorT family protein [Tannerellaceae bacterium]
MKRLILIICLISGMIPELAAQKERVKNQPYADMKLFHLGFHVGLHAQDLLLTHTGVTSDGEIWFAEIPSYSPGFSVGIIGDMYLNPYFNLRFTPTVHFGDKNVTFREYETGEELSTSVRSNYFMLPLDVKFSAVRLNNYRPYLIGGMYTSFDLGRKKGNPLLMKGMDYGLSVGLGCDIYLPFFKLCPEIRLCFGLKDLLEKDRPDLIDVQEQKYTNALSKATSRMIVFTFNFE